MSTAGGLHRALERADGLGAETMQVFVANPRGWAAPAAAGQDDARFAEQCTMPVFVHAPYLINFGSPSPDTVARSGEALAFSLRRGAAIGAAGVVVHAGSAVLGHVRPAAMAQVRDHLPAVLDAVPGAPPLLVEPTAGGGGSLAHDAGSLAEYLAVLRGDERVGVCLDTCHLHAAGHDLSGARGFGAALHAYRAAAGPHRIGLVHVNDSRDPAGSRRDRHAAIGRGTIGREPFATLFTSPVTRTLPLVVETAEADQRADLAALTELRAAART